MTAALPYEVNSATGEPFLRLSAPHLNIILTPPRISDVDVTVALVNDPRVYSYISGPPIPYLETHAIQWMTDRIANAEKAFSQVKARGANNASGVGGCPFQKIREVLDDGSELLLGDISIRRCPFVFLSQSERERMVEINEAKSDGDPTIIWTIGGSIYIFLMADF
jgi:hypothetical protein